MTKTIIKEIGIVLLLLIAILLLMAILFYDYFPNSKTVPVKVQAYNIPEDIKQELGNSIDDEQNIVRTYYIDNSDLDLYESTNDYDKGKANPFADYSIENNKSSNNTIKNNSDTIDTNTTDSNTTDSNDVQQNEQDNTKNEVYINTPGKNY